MEVQKLIEISKQVRRDIIRMVFNASSGHIGGSLGCADFFVSMYFHIIKHNSNFKMKGEDEDVFLLSNGHISPVWYSVLARSGYFDIDELASFRKINSRLQGHPATHEKLPGIRIASGSLGQGISVAIGIAIGKKIKGDNNFVYCLTGDGELQEGQIWEAAMFAPHYKLNNLIVIVDCNGLQISGKTKDVLSLGNLNTKWKSFGWDVLEMDGHSFEHIISTIKKAQKSSTNPTVILMNTVMGKGVDFMENSNYWHGKSPTKEQLNLALFQLEETLGDFQFK